MRFGTNRGLFQGFLRYIADNNMINDLNITSSKIYQPDRVPQNVIDYSSSTPFTADNDVNLNQYIQIELKKYFLGISAYALGYSDDNYPGGWDFSVSIDGINWKTLHTPRDQDELYGVTGLIYKVRPKGYARFFKWTYKQLNANVTTWTAFYIRYLDLYGDVLKCQDNCALFPHVDKCTKVTKHSFCFNILSFMIISIC